MKLCVVDVIAAHYRANIFQKIAKTWDTCWLFGKEDNGIKQLGADSLPDLHIVKNKQLFGGRMYYQTSVISKLFDRGVGAFLLNGEPMCLSMWVILLLRPIVAPRKKVYLWSHGWYGREGFVKKWIKRFCTALSSGIFVYGNYARQVAISQGNHKDKLWVIHNSLDYETHISLLKSIKSSYIYSHYFNNSDPVLLFIGRLTESKRLDMLIKATANLRDAGHNYNVVIVGNGTQKEALEEFAKALNVPVWFYGACYDDKTNAELIYNADLCVSPGNIGLTAIHSLTFGTPAITHSDYTHQGPEFEAIKEGETGGFFEEGNVQSLADAIERWVKEHPDREAVRHACYREIEESWTPDFQLSQFKKHIKL